MSTSRRNPESLTVIGIAFVVLSAAMMIWHGSTSDPGARGTLTGGLIVLALGIYLIYRRRRWPHS